ncbi:MAG TPA: nuclear transport factor 2 family protein [Pseudomonadales bacterium]|jgi:ketosteroid isomerase-like protein|nr:nuclear transport factor 2 family protein [Pseudomonadales bacterium]HNL92386.1 nuclear transport factor 2 family protein [Pseudomonadales bacterium]
MSDFTITNAAQAAAQRSIDAVRAKNKEAWVDNFADDACIEDPVGKSPLDASGNGHRGKAAIAAFWDMCIASGSVDFNIRESYPVSDIACANVGSILNTMGDMKIEAKGVFIYHVNAEGKVTNLRAYWDFNSTMAAASKK